MDLTQELLDEIAPVFPTQESQDESRHNPYLIPDDWPFDDSVSVIISTLATMEGHHGTLPNSHQLPQLQPNLPHYYNPTDYQYTPQQHWLNDDTSVSFDPTVDHNYSSSCKNCNQGFGHHYGYQTGHSSTIHHHTNQQHQFQQQQPHSSSSLQYQQQQLAPQCYSGHLPPPQLQQMVSMSGNYSGNSSSGYQPYAPVEIHGIRNHILCQHQHSISNSTTITQIKKEDNPTPTPVTPRYSVNPNYAHINPRIAWNSSTESMFPGGLNVLWREVPEECQKIITFQDVPESAKFRGYFTVCELLELKRSLMQRLTSISADSSATADADADAPTDAEIGRAVKDALTNMDKVQSEVGAGTTGTSDEGQKSGVPVPSSQGS